MKVNEQFSLTPPDYVPPEVKLEIKLKPYPHPPTTKTPCLTGYVRMSVSQLKLIERVILEGDGAGVYLRVALWDNPDKTEVTGVIEYKEFRELAPPPIPNEVSENSIWY
jgi:hypothetical protein